MHIDDLLNLATAQAKSDDPKPMQIPQNWTQGRTAFGGLSAALVYQAIKQHVTDDRVMRAFNCNFIGPLLPDKDFIIETEMLRSGKNATQVLGRIMQDGNIAVLCQVCFGVSRDSKVSILNHEKHDLAQPTRAKYFPPIPKVVPKFLKHVDLCIESGGLPFTGSKLSQYHGWMRFKKAPKQFTDAHIIALVDAWPPTVIQMLRWPAPVSSINWNLEFLHPHKPMQADDWLAYKVQTRQAAAGYAHTEANIWDAHGDLIALSRQTVGVFD